VTARIVQLNTSPGGVPKLPIGEALCSTLGLAGDGHEHTKIHGGPERALCLYAVEVITALQAEGHPLTPGSCGENVDVAGLEWATLAVGQRFALGDEVIIQLTRPTEPCKQIAASFVDRQFRRIDHDRQPGWSRWYARVEREGILRVGQTIVALG
jgi:MOSC domain-containing protein YiiM